MCFIKYCILLFVILMILVCIVVFGSCLNRSFLWFNEVLLEYVKVSIEIEYIDINFIYLSLFVIRKDLK